MHGSPIVPYQLIALIKHKKQIEQERQGRVQHNDKVLKGLGIKQGPLSTVLSLSQPGSGCAR